jgi:hypothetical protein
VILFYENKLDKAKGRFVDLSRIAAIDGIKINKNNARMLIIKWQQTGSVSTLASTNRNIAHTKVSHGELGKLNEYVERNRFITARIVRNKLSVNVSVRTVEKYFNLMGWKKTRSKYCQAVSRVNRIKRIIYANICLKIKYNFDCTVFIDESKIQASKNAHRKWHKKNVNETRLGNLIDKILIHSFTFK